MARILFASWRVAEMARGSEYRRALTTTAHSTTPMIFKRLSWPRSPSTLTLDKVID
jgi:hypothetical protein